MYRITVPGGLASPLAGPLGPETGTLGQEGPFGRVRNNLKELNVQGARGLYLTHYGHYGCY